MIIESRSCRLICLHETEKWGWWQIGEYLSLVKGGGRTQLEVNIDLWE